MLLIYLYAFDLDTFGLKAFALDIVILWQGHALSEHVRAEEEVVASSQPKRGLVRIFWLGYVFVGHGLVWLIFGLELIVIVMSRGGGGGGEFSAREVVVVTWDQVGAFDRQAVKVGKYSTHSSCL